MQVADFTSLSPGRLVKSGGTHAFVPEPAPRVLDLDATTIGELARAGHAIGELSGVSRRLVNPYLYFNALIRKEALTSSRIEGTVATPDEVARAELHFEGATTDAVEVGNFVDATQHALKRIRKDRRFSLPLMLDAHRVLMKGVRGQRKKPGEIRMQQIWIGSGALADARFVPPPPHELPALLKDLDAFMNDDGASLPLLVRDAVAHYQFETIHPFEDGNGRMGRLIIALMLIRDGLLPGPVLPISTSIERRKAEYMDSMLAVSRNGEWNAWIRFFLSCAEESARETLAFLARLEKLHDSWIDKVQSTRASARIIKVVDALFARPVITIGEAGRLMRVTPAAASAAISKLERLGILTEVSKRKRDRTYVARAIIALLN